MAVCYTALDSQPPTRSSHKHILYNMNIKPGATRPRRPKIWVAKDSVVDLNLQWINMTDEVSKNNEKKNIYLENVGGRCCKLFEKNLI